VPDPAAFARALFIETLRGEGIAVKSSPLKAPRVLLPDVKELDRLPRVALFRSPPFSEEIKVILKVSHNLHASTLPLLLAVKNQQRTLPAGMRLEGKVLADLGVPVDAIALESGAGGGNGDRVSPTATVQLLLAMNRRSDASVYRSALPILGVDGTLADVVDKKSPVRGAVHAKTGTYVDLDLLNDRLHLRSKAMAGYMTTAGGRELVFAFFVNDVSLPLGVEASREGKALGRLCEIIHQYAP
jgi:serine-type D-Ala-D-Ala carboxypeptidase/endopeptidase (penicillin-binding protein 4)